MFTVHNVEYCMCHCAYSSFPTMSSGYIYGVPFQGSNEEDLCTTWCGS